MNVADELERLQSLYEKGALSADELARAKARVLGDSTTTPSMVQQFRRSKSDRVLGGVCGGLGRITDLPSWTWRIIFCLCIFGVGFGFLVYVLLWIFVPEE